MGYIKYKSWNNLECTQTDESFWTYNLGRSAHYTLSIATNFFSQITTPTTFAGISKSKNRSTYSCNRGPGYNKMDAPGNGLLSMYNTGENLLLQEYGRPLNKHTTQNI